MERRKFLKLVRLLAIVGGLKATDKIFHWERASIDRELAIRFNERFDAFYPKMFPEGTPEEEMLVPDELMWGRGFDINDQNGYGRVALVKRPDCRRGVLAYIPCEKSPMELTTLGKDIIIRKNIALAKESIDRLWQQIESAWENRLNPPVQTPQPGIPLKPCLEN
ncbi:MAG: hypothetical protein ACD_57C00338G0001 [uncultured bacterium]|uniref:Uncharacterized protein n=1 Tax=Candidatus Curtissbacteria bacterium RIFOXYA1_FULL_41_14 TaxID=1797737 RepID=A0A1F5HGB8_9BACT|nr:MAG: hypothetical protein ACD_57C00338G0001 [uncultured bacterium]KKR58462.1 MAG: hypothetical protein UT95_C0005G0030 [Candidatus Curtissbacteria bacterium GW2011_GWB1_40_28]KKR61135.1 MAG: hypothetical protein UT99_C0002G0064 [Candidatus Curtissbacteria bacterium GW2011_GWA2_40_31]KKR61905.1 MAG: hypothetical protein UU00_C0006G0032 [Microgenomates group bacterium GW2011_GWC1_40_35]KKR65982.1 MAG: hypothetical protein UU05_C0007G0030 [Candidatus Curtissbacteria bacterium GW2011_GWA1_40_47]